ncbi:hypothetical protein KI387_012502 [Taxus chinensis]|uniref:Disease resistance protein winged helix domain-containing protein n=1 Tax=Taxus chinensis TaxID=29808 RepID=A0AA38CPW4_TAXCH|nr:hypothetical protein KI387_012502 [Taxus chinensis]
MLKSLCFPNLELETGVEMGERKHSTYVEEEEDDTSVCKHFRGLIHMLEDEEEDPSVADEEVVSSVMKILEEEISCCYLGSREDAVSADDKLCVRLRLSYDALADFDVALHLCFLYVSAFLEDEVIFTGYVSQLWIGEGFVTGQDPLQTRQQFINLFADRYLIEPLLKDSDGKVVFFKVHDMLHDLAQQIAEKEEKCFFRARRNL